MSTPQPLEITLEIVPTNRHEAIDMRRRLRLEIGDSLDPFRRLLLSSHHTTAGYLDPDDWRFSARSSPDAVLTTCQALFPAGADYRHDRMDERIELTDAERVLEPPNADAHLTFIGSGLQNCVTVENPPDEPVVFMDLDGEFQGRRRHRTTSITAYTTERPVDRFWFSVPVSAHAVDSVNLSDAQLGLEERIEQAVRRAGVGHGRVDLRLDDDERHAAVTVNEYETLLMRHDLAEVLRDPLRFMARQGRDVLRDPRAVPTKTIEYAKYDVVRVLNRLLDRFGLEGTVVERLMARAMAVPAERLLRFKRALSFAISPDGALGPQLVRGRYQSPILIQWTATPRRHRRVEVTVHRFR